MTNNYPKVDRVPGVEPKIRNNDREAANVQIRQPDGETGSDIVVEMRKTKVPGEQTRVSDVSHLRPAAIRLHGRPIFTVNRFLFIFLFLIPSIIGTVYYGLLESNIYQSFAEMTVLNAGDNSTVTTISPSLMGHQSVSTAAMESEVAQDYIQSRQIIGQLQNTIDIRGLWGRPTLDWYSRLPRDASDEKLYTYYNSMVLVAFDDSTGLISLQVTAFTPGDAKKIATAIVNLTDDLINVMADKARRETLSFTDDLVTKTRARLENSRLAVTHFRNTHSEYDPTKTASAIGQIASEIEGQLAQAYSTVDALRGKISDNAPQVSALKSRISSLQDQLRGERERLANPDGGGKYSALTEEYGRLVVEEGFATTDYTGALALQETARAEVALKHNYIISFIPPSSPDAPPRWHRLEWVATIVFSSFSLYFLVALMIAGVREHLRS
jgi:capsular polysaccharide transport system permease protein